MFEEPIAEWKSQGTASDADAEARQDELTAMEALLGEQFKLISQEAMTFSLGIELVSDKTSQFTLKTPQGESIQVCQLPDVELYITLCQGYPSQNAPHVRLCENSWVPKDLEAELVSALLGRFQPQVPVVFDWYEFIKYESVSHFFSGPIEMSTGSLQSVARASSTKEQEMFRKSFHSCMICLDDHAGKEMIQLPCKHAFCRECLSGLVQVHVKEADVLKLICPIPDCGCTLPPQLVSEFCTEKEFEKYERVLLSRTLDQMGDIRYCPRCSSACIADDETLAQCPSCLYAFCPDCNQAYHPRLKCKELKLSKYRRREPTPEERERWEQLQKAPSIEQRMLDMSKSIQAIFASNYRRCPRCRTAIEKTVGCNHMRCVCGADFCYACGSSSCTSAYTCQNSEWSSDGMSDENARRVAAMELTQVMEVSYKSVGKIKCKNCKSMNPISDWNIDHITCLNCKSNLCIACAAVVPQEKVNSHFGRKNGCKKTRKMNREMAIRRKKDVAKSLNHRLF